MIEAEMREEAAADAARSGAVNADDLEKIRKEMLLGLLDEGDADDRGALADDDDVE